LLRFAAPEGRPLWLDLAHRTEPEFNGLVRCASHHDDPVGVLTGLLGAPFFLLLLVRARRREVA